MPTPDAHPDEGDGETVTLIYFFVPLPEYLRVPDGWTVVGHEWANLNDPRPHLPDFVDDRYYRAVRVSAAFHKVDSPHRFHGMTEALRAAHAAFPALADKAEEIDWDAIPDTQAQTTVAEVAVVADPDAEDPVSDAFDRGLEYLRSLQSAYSLVAHDPVHLVERAMLPFLVPFAERRVTVGEDEPAWPSELGLFAVNLSTSAMPKIGYEDLEGAQLEAVTDVGSIVDGGAFGAFVDVRREAQLALRSGNRLTTAVLVGAAAEALFRELHAMLLWEEGRLPSECVESLRERTITNVVKTEFHNRLGGSWSLDLAGPVRDWRRSIANLRDRALHLGERPSSDSLDQAFAALAAVERFVADRLRASAAAYPVTAGLFGHPEAEEAVPQAYAVPLDPPAVVRRWMAEVQRHREEGPFEGSTEHADVVMLLYPSGDVRWWLVDRQTGLACLAGEPDLTDEQLSWFTGEVAELVKNPPAEPVSIQVGVEAAPAPLAAEPEWVSVVFLLPGAEALRYPASPIPPSEPTDASAG